MNTYSIGIIPSYIYTTFYISANKIDIIKYDFIKNKDISEKLVILIENMILKNKIHFITIFTGPSTSITCKSLISFIKGYSIAKKIPIINIFGERYYIYNKESINIIDIFNKKFIYIENNKTYIKTKPELENVLEKNNKVIFFSGINNLKIEKKNLCTVLFPNIKYINANSYKKFKNLKNINLYEKLNSYNPF